MPDYEDVYDLEHMDDEEIRQLVEQELDEYAGVEPDPIEIAVDDGAVTLRGRIGTEQEYSEIEHILTDVVGIEELTNELIVDELVREQQSPAADDAAVNAAEARSRTGGSSDESPPSAEHLGEDREGELHGTTDPQKATERGESYHPPDRPTSEGSRSREDH